MQPNSFSPQFLAEMNDYWKSASQTAANPIYLYDNPLFKEFSPTVEVAQSPRKQTLSWINFSLLKLASATH